VATPADPRRSVLAGAYECIGRYGLDKTTLEDVAKASGVSRATIYRLFPGGRDQLLRETVGWEMNRFFARLADAVAGAPDLATRIETALVFAHRAVREHEVLQKVLVTEPGAFVPLMTLESQRVLGAIAEYLLPLLTREAEAGHLRPGVDLDHAADYLARMVLSLIGTPGRWDLEDPAAVRTLVRTELLGGILAPGAGPAPDRPVGADSE
jgi:TetR/AcrR family transcriptional regulator, repressor for uid operon